MRGWGIEERRQSDVSAYSRAKERIVTKEAVFCFERCLVLVSFFDTDIVVSPSDIEFGEDPGVLYLGD